MVSSKDVDICVTCIADKPPHLPLREELVSLGVEVIYNASGTGSKVANRETRRRVKGYRKEADAELRKSKSFRRFWKSEKDLIDEDRNQKLIEKKLRSTQTSISYESYCSVLNANESSDDSSSLSSMSSFSTSKSSQIYSVGITHLEIVQEEHGDKGVPESYIKSNNQEDKSEGEVIQLLDQVQDLEVEKQGDCSLTRQHYMREQDQRCPVEEDMVILKDSHTLVDGDDAEPKEPTDQAETSFQPATTLNSRTKHSSPEHLRARIEKSRCDSFGNDSQESTFLKPEVEMKSLVSGTGNRWWYENKSSINTPLSHEKTIDSNEDFCLTYQHANRANEVDSGSNTGLSVMDEGVWTENSASKFDETPCNSSKDILSIKPITESKHLLAEVGSSESEDTVNYTESELFEILKLPSIKSDKVDQQLEFRPLPVSQTLQVGNLPLHEICSLGLQPRLKDGKFNSNLDILLSDLNNFKTLLHTVLECDIGACKVADFHGDLPIHLVGRRLIEWEEQWSSNFLDMKSIKDGDAIKIEMLYQGMSFCIELLLKPIVASRGLCRKGGSVGRLLPLHIACIFPISTEKAKDLLETYPEAAEVPCDFGDLSTNIQNDSIALELLSRTRGIPSLMTEGELKSLKADEKELQDLVFAFYPNVDPFRRENERLVRVECLIKSSARKLQCEKSNGKNSKLDAAAQSAWVWFCTFDKSIDGIHDDYSRNVNNIVCGLGIEEVNILASVKTYSGTILNIATKACVDIIKARLVSGAKSPIIDSSGIGPRGRNGCYEAGGKELSWRDKKGARDDDGMKTLLSSLPQQSCQPPSSLEIRTVNGFENPFQDCKCEHTGFLGSMLKKVFNLRGHAHPTSFVILPYKLVKDSSGAVVPEDASSSLVAAQFSKYILKMTNPQFLCHQLEKKLINHVVYRLPISEMERWISAEEKERNIEKCFLELYSSNPAYLYLLDDEDGIPIVEGQNAENDYPAKVDDAMNIVRQILPMMLQGMILMRDDCALVVLIRTLIEGGRCVPDEWLKVCKRILTLLCNATANSDARINAALGLKDALSDFLEDCSRERRNPRIMTADGSEWIIQLTLLKLILDGSEIRRSFAGLKPMVSLDNGETIWTRYRQTCICSKVMKKGRNAVPSSSGHANCDFEQSIKHFSAVNRQFMTDDNSLEDKQSPQTEKVIIELVTAHMSEGAMKPLDDKNEESVKFSLETFPNGCSVEGITQCRPIKEHPTNRTFSHQSALYSSGKLTKEAESRIGTLPSESSESTLAAQIQVYKSFSPLEAWNNFLTQQGIDPIIEYQQNSDSSLSPSGGGQYTREEFPILDTLSEENKEVLTPRELSKQSISEVDLTRSKIKPEIAEEQMTSAILDAKITKQEKKKQVEALSGPVASSQIKQIMRLKRSHSKVTDSRICLHTESDPSRNVERALSLIHSTSFRDEQSSTTTGSHPKSMNLNQVLKQSVSDLSIQSMPVVSQERGLSGKILSTLHDHNQAIERINLGSKMEDEVQTCQIKTSKHRRREKLKVDVVVNESYAFDIAETTEERIVPIYKRDETVLEGYFCERKQTLLSLSKNQSFEYQNADTRDNMKGVVNINTDDSMHKLMTRLVNLEDRLLRREMELDKVKHDLNNFELELICQSEDWDLALQLEVE